MNLIKNSVTAKEFVEDVKKGIHDSVLQKKYGLSGDRFFLFKAAALDLVAKEPGRTDKRPRKINARQILSDIKSGMDDDSLMVKYELNQRELQKVFRKLIQSGLATALELSSRLSITKSQVREAFVEMGKAIRELD